MIMPDPDAVMDPSMPPPSMVMLLVMVTAPKPPGSRTLIMPPAAVLLIAPAKVLQGAVRLHGLTSSPTPDTQVRVACALAGATRQSPANRPSNRAKTFMMCPPQVRSRRYASTIVLTRMLDLFRAILGSILRIGAPGDSSKCPRRGERQRPAEQPVERKSTLLLAKLV